MIINGSKTFITIHDCIYVFTTHHTDTGTNYTSPPSWNLLRQNENTGCFILHFEIIMHVIFMISNDSTITLY